MDARDTFAHHIHDVFLEKKRKDNRPCTCWLRPRDYEPRLSLGNGIDRYTFEKGALLLQEGQPSDYIFEIESGMAIAYRYLDDDRRQIVEILHAGDVCGITSGRSLLLTVQAQTCITALRYSGTVLENDSLLRQKLFDRLRLQYAALSEHALNLARRSSTHRVANYLIGVIPQRGGTKCQMTKGDSPDATAHIELSRADLADYLGLTEESISRAYTVLYRAGIIEKTSTSQVQTDVHIPDMCRLCQFAGGFLQLKKTLKTK
jgi:CRP-like cAMP-binding protein